MASMSKWMLQSRSSRGEGSNTRIFFINILILVVLQISTTNTSDVVQGDIYSGEHFNDIFLSRTGAFRTNVLLILYAVPCSEAFYLITSQTHGISPTNVLSQAYHNATLFFELAGDWLNITPEMDLWSRYGTNEKCLHVLMFKRGMSTEDPPLRWEEDVEITSWIWLQLQIALTFVNQLAQDINVRIENMGYGPFVAPIHLPTHSHVSVNAYPISLALIFSDGGFNFISGRVLSKNSKVIISTDRPNSSTPEALTETIKKKIDNEENLYSRWLAAQAIRNFLLINQPPYVPQLTLQGMEVMSIQPAVLSELFKFYVANSHRRQSHICNKLDELLSPQDANNKCSLVHLDSKIRHYIMTHMQILAEQFCSCQVQITHIEPFIVYNRGNTAYQILEPPLSHMITVSVRVLADHVAPEWTRLVTCPDQTTHHVNLRDGEALVYESARCWHGRDGRYSGNLVVEIDAHFTVLDDDKQLPDLPFEIYGTGQHMNLTHSSLHDEL